jgi:hypothetical protein
VDPICEKNEKTPLKHLYKKNTNNYNKVVWPLLGSHQSQNSCTNTKKLGWKSGLARPSDFVAHHVQQNEYQQVCWNSEESMFQRLAPARKQSNKNSLSAFCRKMLSTHEPCV